MFLGNLFRFLPQNELGKAMRAFQDADYEDAGQRFDALLSSGRSAGDDVPRFAAESWIQVGHERLDHKDYSGALGAFERALVLRPGYADIHHSAAQLHERSGNLERAQRGYERAIEINPQYFQARLSLARLLIQVEDTQEALVHLQKAAAAKSGERPQEVPPPRDPNPTDPASEPPTLGNIEALFEKLERGSSANESTQVQAALQALKRGDNKLAIQKLKGLLLKNPQFPDLHNLLGIAYDNEGMIDDAIEEFEDALMHNPDFLDARTNLGLTLFGRGHFELAERHLKLVLKQKPDHEIVQTVLEQIAANSNTHA